MTTLRVHQVPVLEDNYVYLLRDPLTEISAVVDPAVARPVLAALDRLEWNLHYILNTHHHTDHVGGNIEIKRATGCQIVGSRTDARRIPGIDISVEEGDEVSIGTQTARVIELSGHTVGHIAYWFWDAKAVFCGDTLFALGCGRLFEGTAEQMWRSLEKLRKLPPETQVYCAHEYTQSNAKFAITVDPKNQALKDRVQDIDRLRAEGKPTVPSTIGEEVATNPFLRADDDKLKNGVGFPGRTPTEVFAALRRRKDSF